MTKDSQDIFYKRLIIFLKVCKKKESWKFLHLGIDKVLSLGEGIEKLMKNENEFEKLNESQKIIKIIYKDNEYNIKELVSLEGLSKNEIKNLTKVKKLYKELKNNNKYKLLTEEEKIKKEIKFLKEELPISFLVKEKEIKKNFILNEKGKKEFVSPETLRLIETYLRVIKNKEVINENTRMDKKTGEKSLEYATNYFNKKDKELTLKEKLRNVINGILSSTRKDVPLKAVKEQLINRNKSIIYTRSIAHVLQLTYQNQNRYQLEKIKTTSFCLTLGSVYISTMLSLTNFFNINFTNLTDKQKILIKEIILSIRNQENHKKRKNLYKKLLNKETKKKSEDSEDIEESDEKEEKEEKKEKDKTIEIFDIYNKEKCKETIEILDLYFMKTILKLNNNTKLDIEIRFQIKEDEEKKISYDEKLQSKFLQIGSVIYEFMKNEGIIIENQRKINTKEKNTKNNFEYLKTETMGYTMDIDPKIKEELMKKNSLYNPKLITSEVRNLLDKIEFINNKDEDEEDEEEEEQQFLIENEDERPIHEKDDIICIIKENCYLKKGNPEFKITIDNRQLLYFLEYLEKFISIDEKEIKNLLKKQYELNEKNYDFIAFLSLYNIDNENIQRIYNEKENKKIIEMIIEYSILLNENPFISKKSKDIEKELEKIEKQKQISKEKLKEIKTIFNKIKNNKLFIVGILEEAILYSSFGFLIIGSFLDSRLRLYIAGYLLNFQNYTLSRSFLKMTSLKGNEEKQRKNFDKVKEIIINSLVEVNKELSERSEEIKLWDYDDYIKKNKEENYNFILKRLKGDKENLENLLKNLESEWEVILRFSIENSEKSKEIFENASIIFHIKKPMANIENAISYDIKSSGSQIISLIFQDIEGGKISNLIGEKKKDLYQEVSNDYYDFFTKILKLKRDIERFFSIEIKIQEKIIINNEKVDSLTTIGELLNAFLNLDFYYSTGKPELIIKLFIFMKDFFIEYPLKNYEEISEGIKMFVNSNRKDIITIKIRKDREELNPKIEKYEKFLDFLLAIKTGVILFESSEKGKDEIIEKVTSRSIVKPSIMTLSYGSTSYRRKIKNIDNLEKIFIKNGYFYSDKILKDLSYLIESYFTKIIKFYLKACYKILLLAKEIKNQPLTIDNLFMKMTINPRVYLKSRFVVFTYNQIRRQVTLQYQSNIFHDKKMKNTVIPNLIHSLDAELLHIFIIILIKIREELSPLGYDFGFFTIHDNFWSTLAPVHAHLLMEAILIFKKNLKEKSFFERIEKTAFNIKILEEFAPTKEEEENFNKEKLNNHCFT